MNLFKSNSQKLAVILLSVILFSSIPAQMTHALGFDFSTPKNISNDLGNSKGPQVGASGNNIYLIWKNAGTNEIYFSDSNDGGAGFSASTTLSTSGKISESPQVTSSGANVFTVWKEGTDVAFKRSTTNGNSFDSTIILGDSGTDSSEPQVASTGDDVFVVYSEDFTDIFLSSSINSGSSFASPVKLSTTAESFSPQIATSGSNAFVVWEEYHNGISFIKGSETGGVVSLGDEISLSDSASAESPQVASSGNKVFVVWKDGNDIFVTNSTDNGATFSSVTDIGDAISPPHISMSGNNVHVVWTDDSSGDEDVMYSSSIEGGAFTTKNLSDNTSSSQKPQIASDGSNVYLTWTDDSSGNIEIIFQGSDDDGTTFTERILSGAESNPTDNPQIAISGTAAHVVWEGDTTNSEIFYSVGPSSGSTISFAPSGQLKLGEPVTITVSNSGTSGTIDVHVKSSTGDPVGFDLSLGEIGVETHSGDLSFSETEDSSQADRRLKANPGDTITVTFDTNTATNTILPRTISFSSVSSCLTPNDDNHDDLPDLIWFKVEDENSNTNVSEIDSVTIQVTSHGDPIGIPLVLKETGVDTGIFGGSSSSPVPQLIFYENQGLIPEQSSVTIFQEDTEVPESADALNKNSTAIDTTTQLITSTSPGSGILQVTLTETDVNSSLFSANITLSNTATNNATSTLLAEGGDIVTFFALSGASPDMLALVTPADPSQGAIKVVLRPDPDKIVASLGTENSAEITVREFCEGQGGGGGGLVRPSLVVNALAGIGGAAGGGSAYSSPQLHLGNLVLLNWIDVPSEVEEAVVNHNSQIPVPAYDLGYFADFKDYPLVIDDKGFILSGFETTIETQTLQTHTPHTIKFLFYESELIQHFSLYTNLRGTIDAIFESDTQILYNANKDLQVIDPNGFFESVTVNINELDDNKKEVVLEITFAKPMEKSDVWVRSWDPNLYSGDTHILDAWEIVDEIIEEAPIPTYETPQIQQLQSTTIPLWIKSNAGWWSDQQISDDDFVAGLEYLIKNEIINVPGVEVIGTPTSTEIPDWIQNNAGWWAESLISDDDFIEAMQWLIANGVIQL